MKKSMDDHVFRDRATELQRAKKLSAADRKKEAKLQASKAPAATQAKGNTKGKTTEKRKKEDVDEEEEHYWDDQEAIDEEEDSYARLRDAQREIVDEEEESEASGVALALLQPRSASEERGRSLRTFRILRRWKKCMLTLLSFLLAKSRPKVGRLSLIFIFIYYYFFRERLLRCETCDD